MLSKTYRYRFYTMCKPAILISPPQKNRNLRKIFQISQVRIFLIGRLTLHSIGSKKRCDRRTILFTIRVYVIDVMVLLAQLPRNINPIAVIFFKFLINRNFFLFSLYYCLSTFVISISIYELGKTVLYWSIIIFQPAMLW